VKDSFIISDALPLRSFVVYFLSLFHISLGLCIESFSIFTVVFSGSYKMSIVSSVSLGGSRVCFLFSVSYFLSAFWLNKKCSYFQGHVIAKVASCVLLLSGYVNTNL